MKLLTDFIETESNFTLIKVPALTSCGWLSTYFIIDTGSTTSLFTPEVGKAGLVYEAISGLSGATLTSKKCTATLSFHNVIARVEGNIIDQDLLPYIEGKHLSGILGNDFFAKYNLILDFLNGGIYAKDVSTNDIAEASSMPMNLETNSYNIPTISIGCNSHHYDFVVDTGSTNNMVTSMCPCCNNKETSSYKPYIIEGIASRHVAKECELKFRLCMSCRGNLIEHDFSEAFTYIEPEHIGERLSYLGSIQGIIGNDFIHRRKWIMDFAEKKIIER